MRILTIGALVTGTMAAAIVAMGMSTTVASAGTVENNNIHINKSRLKGKCRRAGGKFTTNKKGGYGCLVDRPGGTWTTVNCTRNRNCVGYTETSSRVSRKNRRPFRRSNRQVTRRVN